MLASLLGFPHPKVAMNAAALESGSNLVASQRRQVVVASCRDSCRYEGHARKARKAKAIALSNLELWALSRLTAADP